MASGDLTSLANAKAWIGITGAQDDANISTLITAASSWFKRQVCRDLIYQAYVEPRNGTGTIGMAPFQYPVQSGDSIVVNGQTIPKQPAQTEYGWVLVQDRFEIVRGGAFDFLVTELTDGGDQPYGFRRGYGNCVLSYKAGFLKQSEPATVPNPGPYTVQSQEFFVADQGVTYTNAAPLAKVSSVPIAGQYSVGAAGLYTFAAADQGVAVLLTYAYVPADIEQAVKELILWKWREKDRVGQISKTLGGGETIMFSQASAPPSVKDAIDAHRRMNI